MIFDYSKELVKEVEKLEARVEALEKAGERFLLLSRRGDFLNLAPKLLKEFRSANKDFKKLMEKEEK